MRPPSRLDLILLLSALLPSTASEPFVPLLMGSAGMAASGMAALAAGTGAAGFLGGVSTFVNTASQLTQLGYMAKHTVPDILDLPQKKTRQWHIDQSLKKHHGDPYKQNYYNELGRPEGPEQFDAGPPVNYEFAPSRGLGHAEFGAEYVPGDVGGRPDGKVVEPVPLSEGRLEWEAQRVEGAKLGEAWTGPRQAPGAGQQGARGSGQGQGQGQGQGLARRSPRVSSGRIRGMRRGGAALMAAERDALLKPFELCC